MKKGNLKIEEINRIIASCNMEIANDLRAIIHALREFTCECVNDRLDDRKRYKEQIFNNRVYEQVCLSTMEIGQALSSRRIKYLPAIDECSLNLDSYFEFNGYVIIKYKVDANCEVELNDLGIQKLQEDINKTIEWFGNSQYQKHGEVACGMYPHLARGVQLIDVIYEQPLYLLTFKVSLI